MNKSLKTFLIVLCAIVLVSFLIFKVIEYKNEKENELNYLTIEDFTKTEVDGKTILENKDIGLRFTVPQGWETGSSYWSNISLVSPDFEPLRNDPTAAPLPQKGCWIDVVFVAKVGDGIYRVDYDFLKNLINSPEYLESNNTEKETYEIIEVNGLKAVKNIYKIDNENNEDVFIQIPFGKNRAYSFNTYLVGQDKERCLEEFNSFISSVSIY